MKTYVDGVTGMQAASVVTKNLFSNNLNRQHPLPPVLAAAAYSQLILSDSGQAQAPTTALATSVSSPVPWRKMNSLEPQQLILD